MGNAVKFTERGRVTVTVDVAVTEGETTLHVCVEDTGIGLSPEAQKRVFAPFPQADTSMTRTYGGTGLGLSVSRQLVELMGGLLWVESPPSGGPVPGEGSAFHFTVPLRPCAPREAVAEPEPVPFANRGAGALRVLVAEDAEINRLVAARMLEKDGHTVVLAANGREAVERWREGAIDLILMDVQMPVMDGLTATAAIRAEEKGTSAHVPIAALTAHARKHDRARCLAAGMDGYLSKPFRGKEVRRLLARIAPTGDTTARPAPPARGETVLDPAYHARQFGSDPNFLRELLTRFGAELPGRVEAIQAAAAGGVFAEVERLAHSLKGVAATVGAPTLKQVASALTEAARGADRAGLATLTLRLALAAEALQESLPGHGESPRTSDPHREQQERF